MNILGIILALLAVLACAGIKMSSVPTLQADRENWRRQMEQREKTIRMQFDDQAKELDEATKQLAKLKGQNSYVNPRKAEFEQKLAQLQTAIDTLSAKLEQEKAKRPAAPAPVETPGNGGGDGNAVVADDDSLKERAGVLREEINVLRKNMETVTARPVSAEAVGAGFNPVPPVQ